MKHKVGNKVRVHSTKWFRKNCSENDIGAFAYKDNCYTFVNNMAKFCGQEITINEELLNSYHILEDDGRWCWQDWMFEEKADNILEIGDINIVKDLCNLLGIELGQVIINKATGYKYRFSEINCFEEYNELTNSWQISTTYNFVNILKAFRTNQFIIVWTPKYGDLVYFNSRDLYNYCAYDSENEHLKNLLDCNMLYRTEQEAIEEAHKYMNQMKGEV